MDKLPTLTPESLETFMKQLHDDAALKQDVMRRDIHQLTAFKDDDLVAIDQR